MASWAVSLLARGSWQNTAPSSPRSRPTPIQQRSMALVGRLMTPKWTKLMCAHRISSAQCSARSLMWRLPSTRCSRSRPGRSTLESQIFASMRSGMLACPTPRTHPVFLLLALTRRGVGCSPALRTRVCACGTFPADSFFLLAFRLSATSAPRPNMSSRSRAYWASPKGPFPSLRPARGPTRFGFGRISQVTPHLFSCPACASFEGTLKTSCAQCMVQRRSQVEATMAPLSCGT
mmetsp:Transcript_1583/g.4035  ORF Transcript_1583/g.4035 Transcript_1583/m.4035 type:complete len:234 (+) Transcript_1583:1823-2524(+)